MGQKRPIRLLTTILQKGTIPHALVFIGADGVGKRTAAIAFAMVCNCLADKIKDSYGVVSDHLQKSIPSLGLIRSKGPCCRCKSCRKIKTGNHPDIILVKPSGPMIKIGQIRELCHTLGMKPYEASIRVVIISDAQAMNPSAGNALLKMLEEPPDRTILILTTMQTSDLLPTIVSRCQQIRFNPVASDQIEAFLIDSKGVNAKDAKIIAGIANGSMGKAVSLTTSFDRAKWMAWRKWLIHEIDLLSTRPIGLQLAFASKLSQNKKQLSDSLDIVKSWFRDLVIWKYAPDKIINRDLKNQIKAASSKIRSEVLLSKIDVVQSAQKSIESNANHRLTTEAMIIELRAHSKIT